MNSYKTIESKLWSEVSMLTSGVLTSLLYGLLSGSSYSLEVDGKHYEITSTGMSPWCAIGLVILTFFSLWILISLLVPRLLRIRKRFAYVKIKKASAKEIMKVLDEASATIKELYPIFNGKNDSPNNSDYLKLYSRDLAKTILLLHRNLLPQNKLLRRRIETYFRRCEHASIISIDQKVSDYELAANIALLRRMVNQLNLVAGDDALLKTDCKNMGGYLLELEQITPLPSHQAKGPKTDGCS